MPPVVILALFKQRRLSFSLCADLMRTEQIDVLTTFFLVFICTFVQFHGENIVHGCLLVDLNVFSPPAMVLEGTKSKKDIVLLHAL